MRLIVTNIFFYFHFERRDSIGKQKCFVYVYVEFLGEAVNVVLRFFTFLFQYGAAWNLIDHKLPNESLKKKKYEHF